MCTVSYFPLRNGFILTHNRDEAPGRSPQNIEKERVGDNFLLFPRDTGAGGSWIAASQKGQVACLLNGAFLKHQHRPPYRRSRGLVLLDFFRWENPNSFFEAYELEGIEPFTFLFFQPGRVVEFRWDGTKRHYLELAPDQTHFWSSATLYPPEIQPRRKRVFQEWLERYFGDDPFSRRHFEEKKLPSALSRLHYTGSVGDPENDFVMNRGGRVMTVSITQVLLSGNQLRMIYHKLPEGGRQKRGMKIFSN